MRIAIVHPWYLTLGGAEQVVNVLARMYPEADFFTLFAEDARLPTNLRGRNLKCSFLDHVPHKFYRALLPLYPLAVESLDLRGYDLIISSEGSAIKGVLKDQEAVHICYCHSPMRYIWDLYWEFLQQAPKPFRPVFALIAHYLRQWDFSAAQRVNTFVANSRYIAHRIQQYYRRESTIIYPPVETNQGYLAESIGDYYLSVGRLTQTKRLDLLIRSCNNLKRKLVIAGTGKQEAYLKSLAGPTVEFVGRVPDDALARLYAECRAFVFPADEDFGIAPVEAQAYGRPVIAFGHGGSLETIIDIDDPRSPTGLLFSHQTVDSISEAIEHFENIEHRFEPAKIQQHARKFDTEVFVQEMSAFVDQQLAMEVSPGAHNFPAITGNAGARTGR